jgi:hypothetical protein
VAAGSACADEGFTVRTAPDFPKGRTTISVFGVFKDGRLSTDSWDQLGPGLSSAFADRTCEAAYSDRLLTTAPSLASALDDYARANGLTDELIDQVAPLAQGDAILVITIAGHPPLPIGDAGAQPSRPGNLQPSMRGGGRRGRGGGMPTGTSRGNVTDRSVFEVSASLFSVRLHRSVAFVGMTYSGPSTDEALKRFADKLRTEMPGSTCSGWRWNVHLDDEEIRKMIEP